GPRHAGPRRCGRRPRDPACPVQRRDRAPLRRDRRPAERGELATDDPLNDRPRPDPLDSPPSSVIATGGSTMSALRRQTQCRRPHASRPRRPLGSRLWLCALEDRTAPAVLTVTVPGDAGPNTLRGVVATANANGENDTITFDPSVTAINLST